jgi:hypothetical protein
VLDSSDQPKPRLTREEIARVYSTPHDQSQEVIACFAPDAQQEVIDRYYQLHPEWIKPAADPRYQFDDNNRWPGSQGDPYNVTWSFVPDGVSIPSGVGEAVAPSELFARMDSLFAAQGGRATWIAKVTESFARWGQLAGLTYTRVTVGGDDWDDGETWNSAGAPGLRGEVRIGMKNIDGGSNTLAYNFFPPNGNMVLDRSENWASSSNNFRFMRNIVMHEHGHGLGFFHVCPTLGSRLMEPFLNTGFDGPQHDEIRAAHRGYGDTHESDNSSAAAFDVGTLIVGSPVTLGPVPAPTVGSGSLLSIDATGESDWYRFATTDSPIGVTVSVAPVGFSYDSSPQASGGACTSGNVVNSLSVANLNFEIVDQNGSTVLTTAQGQPAGATETLSNIPLASAPGTFYIRVFTPDVIAASQLYWITLALSDPTADILPPSPNPAQFDISPTPASSTSIAMSAVLSTDQTVPVQYFFDYQFGSGGNDSGWISSNSYVDINLLPNRNYSYRIQTRDSKTPTPNTGTFNTAVQGSTAIETPTGLNFGTVTANSVQVNALGTFSFLTSGSSGLFYEMTPDVPASGANAWVQTNSLIATGLSPGTLYTFRIKARNRNSYETGYTGTAAVLTPGPCIVPGDVNADGGLDGDDVAAFIRVKMGVPLPTDHVECADYLTGGLLTDIEAFAEDMVN